jgi:hypothetical protein
MWMRAMAVLLVAGCVGAGDDREGATATVTEAVGGFNCSPRSNLHTLECFGSVTVFWIDVRIDKAEMLGSFGVDLVGNDLAHVAAMDANSTSLDKILTDIENRIFDDLVGTQGLPFTRDDITVCGGAVCK